MTWGGKRKGAGAPKTLEVAKRVTVDLEGPQLDKVLMVANSRECSVAAAIRWIIDKAAQASR